MVIEEPRTSLAATLANSQEAAIVPAAEPERGPVVEVLARDLAEEGLELDPEVAELERVLAEELAQALVLAEAVPVPNQEVAELERVQVEAVPGPETALVGAAELELVQVAVALRTKSVTTAHHRGLVPRRVAGEDSAVAAETTREPVAAEAVVAWAAAE